MRVLEIAQKVWSEAGTVSVMPIACQTVEALAERGHEVHYLIPKWNGQPRRHVRLHSFWMPFYYHYPEEFGAGVGFLIAKLQYLLFIVLGLLKASRLARTLDPDIIYSHGPSAMPVGSLVGKLRGVPNVSRTYGFVYATSYSKLQQVLNFELQLGLRFPADAYVLTEDGTNVRALAEQWGLPMSKAHFMQEGYDRMDPEQDCDPTTMNEILRNHLEIPLDAEVVLSASSLTKIKRVDHLILALAELHHLCARDVYLIVIGDGPKMEELKVQANELKVSDRVRFLGRQPHREVLKYYHMADIVSAIWAHAPLIEGMLHERCVLTLNIGDADRFIVHKGTGYIMEYENLHTLYRHLDFLLANDELRHQMGKDARRSAENYTMTVEERTSWEVDMMEQLAGVGA